MKKTKSLPKRIFWGFYDSVNTKEKRKYLLIICVPFYTVWIIANYLHYTGLFSDKIIGAILFAGGIIWIASLYVFFCQTEKGKKLRKIVEEQ